MKTIILDNGHGFNTAGKRSPLWAGLGQLYEWEFTRKVVNALVPMLRSKGVDVRVLVPEENDISIDTRSRRANAIAKEVGRENCLLVSVHVNAAPTINQGTGWEIHTYTGTSASDKYADIFWKHARTQLEPKGFRMRGDYTDGDKDWDSNLGILRKTVCPAVLTENLFMDNRRDCEFLMSDEGLKIIVQLHFDAIMEIING